MDLAAVILRKYSTADYIESPEAPPAATSYGGSEVSEPVLLAMYVGIQRIKLPGVI